MENNGRSWQIFEEFTIDWKAKNVIAILKSFFPVNNILQCRTEDDILRIARYRTLVLFP